MNGISPPITNFANAGNNCTSFSDNANVLDCPQLEADIAECQSKGKTILLSLGGATYTQGGFSSSSAAESAAQTVWDMFGTNTASGADRPFGNTVIDGFDFDFESGVNNLEPFAAKLRSLMDASGKKMYLTAAPQCVYPDYADNPALSSGVAFDFLMIQYYNNGCGASSFVPGATTQWNFNFDVWDNWAKTVSANKNVKLLLGLPANTGAGSGYVSGSQLSAVIQECQKYSSFGGSMLWDMSQLYANLSFLSELVTDLGSTPSTTAPPSGGSTTTQPAGGSTTTQPAGGSTTGLAEYAQCGGQGWTGATVCASPYTCTVSSQWYSDCR